MKFVLASYGSRGDIEPSAAVGRELLRRGHEVRMAVPPDLVSFVEEAGLPAVAFGRGTGAWLDVHHNFWTRFFRSAWKVHELRKSWREVWEPVAEIWQDIDTTLTALADDADVLITGLVFEEPAANVAEYYGIPLATVHYYPARANGQLLTLLPAPLTRCATTVYEWLGWRWTKKFEDVQRRELGLPKAVKPASRRMAQNGSLEIQAYDEACFPGLAAEWAKWDGQRPFVGTLTMELPTDADEEVAAWIAAGTPPIYFGFGSIPVQSPADTLAMIADACTRLGVRALVGAGWSHFDAVPDADHIKVVNTVNFSSIFPTCRAVVHHGAAGTTAAGLRAGVPTLVLWTWPDQSLWGARISHLKVGTARRFSATTLETLVDDLRCILAPEYANRAREISRQMTKPAESVAAAADLVENLALRNRVP
ncbi:glycosyltransferase [Mycobacterium neumannii]|uniref:glycosyltransferase n=1 Tax=Mycobacterium neumannii TaxID=2048551 RepID=UPI003AB6F33B